jgi:hypothetical protein
MRVPGASQALAMRCLASLWSGLTPCVPVASVCTFHFAGSVPPTIMPLFCPSNECTILHEISNVPVLPHALIVASVACKAVIEVDCLRFEAPWIGGGNDDSLSCLRVRCGCVSSCSSINVRNIPVPWPRQSSRTDLRFRASFFLAVQYTIALVTRAKPSSIS